MSAISESPVETSLRDELARGDRVLASLAPVLVHLVATPGNALFNDEVVASIRGRASHVATQLLFRQATFMGESDAHGFAESGSDDLAVQLMTVPHFLLHCHALTIEAQSARFLQTTAAIDPVVSPMVQGLIGSDDPGVATDAMAILAAQARFFQQQERMELPLREMPLDVVDAVVAVWRRNSLGCPHEIMAEAEAELRAEAEGHIGRLARIERMAAAIGQRATEALSVAHGGLALFASALALATDQAREVVIVATSEQQAGRLALMLIAAGLDSRAAEEQYRHFHPDGALPRGLESVPQDRARAILSGSHPRNEG